MPTAATIAEPTPQDHAPPPPAAGRPATFPPFRLTVDRYLRMVEAGIFGEDEPVVLWNGELVRTMTKGPDHSNALTELYGLLSALLPREFQARQEQPVRLGPNSAPEPDLAVTRGRSARFKGRLPEASEVALIVEVADSSLAVDSGEVARAYAAADVPVYWIVNIPERRIEVRSDPRGGEYASRRSYGPGGSVPVVLDGAAVGSIPVDGVLP